MSAVWIERPCTEPEDLPDVCLRCGAETTQRVSKRFWWMPSWVYITLIGGLLVFLIVALIVRKRCRVLAPLCREHKNHWRGRTLLVVGSLAVCIVGSIAVTVATEVLLPPGSKLNVLGPLLLVTGLFAWLVVAGVASATAIRPVEITDRGVKLAGVCKAFVEAYEEREGLDLGRFTDEALARWREVQHGRPAAEDDRYRRDEEGEQRGRYREDT